MQNNTVHEYISANSNNNSPYKNKDTTRIIGGIINIKSVLILNMYSSYFWCSIQVTRSNSS